MSLRSTGSCASPSLATALAPDSLGSAAAAAVVGRGCRLGGGRHGRSLNRSGRGGSGSRGAAAAAAAVVPAGAATSSDWGSRSSSRGARLRGNHSAGDEARAGDLVVDGLVNVDEDARVSGRVELRAEDTRGLVRAAAGDVQVEALRIVLGAALGAGPMQRDELVAEHIVAWRDGRRDLQQPGVVVGDQLIVAPDAGRVGLVDQADGVDLEELQRRLVNRLAGSVAVGQVAQDWAMVAAWPGRPLEEDFVAGSHDGVRVGVLRGLVADYVGGVILVRSDEPVVGVWGLPGDLGWRVRLVRI